MRRFRAVCRTGHQVHALLSDPAVEAGVRALVAQVHASPPLRLSALALPLGASPTNLTLQIVDIRIATEWEHAQMSPRFAAALRSLPLRSSNTQNVCWATAVGRGRPHPRLPLACLHLRPW